MSTCRPAIPGGRRQPRRTEWRAWSIAPFTVLMLVLSGAAETNAAADDHPEENVQRLIEQLDAGSRLERTAAERALMDLGPDVLPHLPPPDQLRSPAAQDAVRRVRELLEREQAERSVRPARVTLSGTFTLAETVRQISEQTGNTIRATAMTPEVLDRSLSLELEEMTFWDALLMIDQRDDVAVRINPDDGVLEIVPEPDMDNMPVKRISSGSFLVTVRAVSLRPDFTDRTRNSIRVTYDVAAEPRLRPLFVQINHADFHLTAGEDLFAPLAPSASRERPADRPGPVPLSTDFVVPASHSVDHVSLSGRLTIELATAQEAFVFRNLQTAEHVVRRRGGVTVTLDEAVLESKPGVGIANARVDIRVVYDQGGPAFESHRTWVYHNDAILRMADSAQEWSYDRFDTQAVAEAAVKMSYRFVDVPADPENLEFVYTAPTRLLSVPVEIEVSDLPVDRTSIESR